MGAVGDTWRVPATFPEILPCPLFSQTMVSLCRDTRCSRDMPLELCGDPQFRPGISGASESRVTTSEEPLCRDRVLRPSWGPQIPTVWVNSGPRLLSVAAQPGP